MEFSFVMSYKTKIFSKVDKFFMFLNINLLFLIFLLNIKIIYIYIYMSNFCMFLILSRVVLYENYLI